jgi:hypothetical protein
MAEAPPNPPGEGELRGQSSCGPAAHGRGVPIVVGAFYGSAGKMRPLNIARHVAESLWRAWQDGLAGRLTRIQAMVLPKPGTAILKRRAAIDDLRVIHLAPRS